MIYKDTTCIIISYVFYYLINIDKITKNGTQNVYENKTLWYTWNIEKGDKIWNKVQKKKR